MSNMSYCRFENTLHDLQDCEEALDHLFEGTAPLSGAELQCAAELVQTCQSILDMVAHEARRNGEEVDNVAALPADDITTILDEANQVAERTHARRLNRGKG